MYTHRSTRNTGNYNLLFEHGCFSKLYKDSLPASMRTTICNYLPIQTTIEQIDLVFILAYQKTISYALNAYSN